VNGAERLHIDVKTLTRPRRIDWKKKKTYVARNHCIVHLNHRIVIPEAVLRYSGLGNPILSWTVGVVVYLGVAKVGDDEVSATCKEKILESDSTVEDADFMDSANGNKLDEVKAIGIRV